MSKQGGNSTKDNYISIHQTIFIFMIVLNIVVLILSIMLLGMQLVKRELRENYSSNTEYIEEMIKLNYAELGEFGYEDDSSSFLKGASTNGNLKYRVFTSKDDLAGMIEDIQRQNANGAAGLYKAAEVPDSFFETGCVIAAAYEDQGLEKFDIKKITRDEIGGITLVSDISTNKEVDGTFGKLVLIKMDNVRVKNIEVNSGIEED